MRLLKTVVILLAVGVIAVTVVAQTELKPIELILIILLIKHRIETGHWPN